MPTHTADQSRQSVRNGAEVANTYRNAQKPNLKAVALGFSGPNMFGRGHNLTQSGILCLAVFMLVSRGVKEGRRVATGPENAGWTASRPCSDLCEDK